MRFTQYSVEIVVVKSFAGKFLLCFLMRIKKDGNEYRKEK